MKKIPKSTEYRLGKDGRLYIPSPWGRRLRSIISVSIAVASFTVVQNNGAAKDIHYAKLEKEFPTPVQQQLKAASIVQKINPDLTEKEARHVVTSTYKWAPEFNLDPVLVLSIQAVESRFRQYAVSSAGALGIMQFIPSWHLDKMKAVVSNEKIKKPDVFDIESNIYIGSWVMKDCMAAQKEVSKALLCYNGSLKNPNGYDTKVLQVYGQMKQQFRI